MKEKIHLIPINLIRIINPRCRDKKKFAKIVENIRAVGLKKPIQVSPRPGSKKEEADYSLICGQGRIEAFQALGYPEIPAIVMKVSREEGMLMSLIENMARRNASPVELVDEIIRLKKLGYSNVAIGRKLDIADTAVGHLLILQKAGEGRLIYEVSRGHIPLGIAVEIAKVEDPDEQKAFIEAYEKNHLNQAAIKTIKRVIAQRNSFGKNLNGSAPRRRCTSAEGLIKTFTKESQRQKTLIKKTNVCESRLDFIVEAMRRLRTDEDFLNLLRAEKFDTMPKELSELISQPSSTFTR
jgi:ParB family chromosome partitioning protein